jgi:hypothetical protein
MERSVAILAQKNCLEAIGLLHSILGSQNLWDEPNLQQLKRGIGLSIGRIETEVLALIYAAHPDLDDLKDL